ncbi:hypothetical protein RRG08_002691 [Elysia crispata]|uniref:Uncharacterized protein n=1 Tax=Elysia crispata TaxID=231223 RepID=A0AAE1CM00_9GAST|nr:hypothetical protein RRG08_002691 [Elysia crispata]
MRTPVSVFPQPYLAVATHPACPQATSPRLKAFHGLASLQGETATGGELNYLRIDGLASLQGETATGGELN